METMTMEEVRTWTGWCLSMGIVVGYLLCRLEIWARRRQAKKASGWFHQPLPIAEPRPRRRNRRVALTAEDMQRFFDRRRAGTQVVSGVCPGGDTVNELGVATCRSCGRPMRECLDGRPVGGNA